MLKLFNFIKQFKISPFSRNDISEINQRFPNFKHALFAANLCLAALLATTVLAGTPGEIEIGGYLRSTTLHGLNGSTNEFSDFIGKPLIINVWASYCGPCLAEMASLERLAQRYTNEFNVIGISIDDDRHAAVAFIERSKVTFKNFQDRKLLLENMLGANRIPLTILVDTDGRVLGKTLGAREWDDPFIIKVIEETFQISL